MKKLIYTLTAFIITHFTFSIGEASAQSWQWAKRGGGSITAASGPDENLNGLTIDKNGNSYIISSVSTNKLVGEIDIDGNKVGKGNGEFDIALVSFDCSGKYRWSKIIGGPSGEAAYSIKTDTFGGIYLVGSLRTLNPTDTVKFAADTFITPPAVSPFKFYKQMFIAKYDTSGAYQWLRMPEPDTLSSFFRYSACLTMDVSPSGVLSLLMYTQSSGAFAKGAYVIPASATLPSMHMLKYDSNGNFIKGFPMAITEGDFLSLTRLRMAWDVKNDVYYLLSVNGGESGIVQPKFGSTKMTGTNCLAKFSNTGASVWVKQSSSATYSGVLSSQPSLDKDGNIYFTASENGGGNFLGHAVVNKLSGNAVPCVFKLSPSGSLLWGKSGSASLNTQGQCMAVSSKGEVAFSGTTTGKMYWDKDSFYAVPANLHFIRLDAATGALISLDSVKGADYEEPQAMICDAKGNYYLGGYFRSTLVINGLSAITKYGGYQDFFIAKFGEAECSSPVSISEQIPAYATVKIYPNPANDKLTLEGAEKGTDITLIDIVGRQVYSGKIESAVHQISLNGLAEGMYLLQLKAADGAVYATKIMKQ